MPSFEELARAQALQMLNQQPRQVLNNPLGAALVGAAAGARPNGYALVQSFAQRDRAALQQAEMNKVRALQLLQMVDKIERDKQEREAKLRAAMELQQRLGINPIQGLNPNLAMQLWRAKQLEAQQALKARGAEQAAKMTGLTPEIFSAGYGPSLMSYGLQLKRMQEAQANKAATANSIAGFIANTTWLDPQAKQGLVALATRDPRMALQLYSKYNDQASKRAAGELFSLVNSGKPTDALAKYAEGLTKGLKLPTGFPNYINQMTLNRTEAAKLFTTVREKLVKLEQQAAKKAQQLGNMVEDRGAHTLELNQLIDAHNRIAQEYKSLAQQLGIKFDAPLLGVKGGKLISVPFSQPQVQEPTLAPIPNQSSRLGVPPAIQQKEAQYQALKRLNPMMANQVKYGASGSANPFNDLYQGFLSGLGLGDASVDSSPKLLGAGLGVLASMVPAGLAGAGAAALTKVPWIARLAEGGSVGAKVLNRAYRSASQIGAVAGAMGTNAGIAALNPPEGVKPGEAAAIAGWDTLVQLPLYMMVFGVGAKGADKLVSKALAKVAERGETSKLVSSIPKLVGTLVKGSSKVMGGLGATAALDQILNSDRKFTDSILTYPAEAASLYIIGRVLGPVFKAGDKARSSLGKALDKPNKITKDIQSLEKFVAKMEKSPKAREVMGRVLQDPKLKARVEQKLGELLKLKGATKAEKDAVIKLMDDLYEEAKLTQALESNIQPPKMPPAPSVWGTRPTPEQLKRIEQEALIRRHYTDQKLDRAKKVAEFEALKAQRKKAEEQLVEGIIKGLNEKEKEALMREAASLYQSKSQKELQRLLNQYDFDNAVTSINPTTGKITKPLEEQLNDLMRARIRAAYKKVQERSAKEVERKLKIKLRKGSKLKKKPGKGNVVKRNYIP